MSAHTTSLRGLVCALVLPFVALAQNGASDASATRQSDAKPAMVNPKNSPVLVGRKNESGGWGLVASGPGLAAVEQPHPLKVEVWDVTLGCARAFRGGYTSPEERAGGWIGVGTLAGANGVAFEFQDEWTPSDGTLRLRRTVTVRGSGPGGFQSAATFRVVGPQTWPEVEWFVPGMIYGNFDHLRDLSIGGRLFYQPGAFSVWIREDRMPAPLLGARFADGSSLAVLNPAPDGATTAAEGASFSLEPMVDARFRFGAIGAEERGRTLALGYSFPGSEGELSYGRKTAKGPETDHQWRRRYHPIKDRFGQRYEVAFRFDRAEALNDFVARTWRWAWQNLNPVPNGSLTPPWTTPE